MTWLWAGIIAVALWVASAFVGTHYLAYLAVLLPFFAMPLPVMRFQAGNFKWTWQDWVGAILTLIVIYAMYKGVDPITLLQWAHDQFAGSNKPK
jgi:hypothetical protein